MTRAAGSTPAPGTVVGSTVVGSTVLTLPSPEASPSPRLRLVPDLRCRQVLVVEDDPSLTLLLERVLSKQGYGVVLTTTGEEGLREVLEHEFDAVVLDVNIPAPDGLEVCRRLRATGLSTPVIMLTAQVTVQDRVEGLDAGADDYLTKPFALAELAARLRALTRRGRGEPPARGR